MTSNRRRIAVIGLGQIGGSLASALRRSGGGRGAGGVTVTGCDRDPRVTAEALRRGLIETDGGNPAGCAAGADVVVLAVPVREIIRLIPNLTRVMRDGAILLDTGSTKRSVVDEMNRSGGAVRCLGGHPIAGTETSGPASWNARLFRGKTFVLTRTASSDDASQKVVEGLLAATGANVRYMDAAVHDRVLALTSHIPLLLANGLVAIAGRSLADTEPPGDFVGGSFLSATRVACKPPDMIADILFTNRDRLLEAYNDFDREVRGLLAAAERDPDVLVARLSALGETHGRIASEGRS